MISALLEFIPIGEVSAPPPSPTAMRSGVVDLSQKIVQNSEHYEGPGP